MSQEPSPFADQSGLERIALFSDAVMAIAITLLVMDLRVPEMSMGLGRALVALWPNYLSYLFSFFIIGSYWLSHHRLFRPIRRYDDRLVLLNLAFLFFVAVIPFSTRLIALYPTTRMAVLTYSLNILPLGLISYAMMRHAFAGNRLIDESADPAEIRRWLDFNRRGLFVFFFCLAVSIAFPVAFWPVWILGFASRSVGRRVWKIR
ncbi:MAG TPA: TMEM175 family protein [Candidatus Bathyarchaeia archaeon]|nr:TMEM175 family protein [Candidatus Bathyarchaeia archaeon]